LKIGLLLQRSISPSSGIKNDYAVGKRSNLHKIPELIFFILLEYGHDTAQPRQKVPPYKKAG
jgi:hypothetical protein